jgi:hypothetical protein
MWLANGFLTWYIWKLAKIIAKKFGFTRLENAEPAQAPGPGPPVA